MKLEVTIALVSLTFLLIGFHVLNTKKAFGLINIRKMT